MLTIETDYHYAGFTVKEGTKVYIPKIKRIGSSDEFDKRDHNFYLFVNKGLFSRTYGHVKMEERNTKIIVERKAHLIGDEVEAIRNIEVFEHARFIMPKLKAISGTITVRKGGHVEMPELKLISGSLIVEEGAMFIAPKLKEVHDLEIRMRN